MKLKHLYDQGVMPIHLGASLLCAGLLAVGWLFGLGPLMSENHQATTVQQQATQAEDKAKAVKAQLDQMAKELAGLQEKLDEQPIDLQSAKAINPLLAELAGWSEQHNLSITRTNAGRREALAYYDYVPIDLAGEGGYGDLLGFFTRLHKQRGDLGLIRFSVSRMPSGSSVRFEMGLAWYVLSDDAPGALEEDERATASVPTP